jgi:hypothetical protein
VTSLTPEEEKSLDISVTISAAEIIVQKFKTIESKLAQMDNRIARLEEEATRK